MNSLTEIEPVYVVIRDYSNLNTATYLFGALSEDSAMEMNIFCSIKSGTQESIGSARVTVFNLLNDDYKDIIDSTGLGLEFNLSDDDLTNRAAILRAISYNYKPTLSFNQTVVSVESKYKTYFRKNK